ncbi:hypothetical protein V5740_07685 [Croceibacterium sp. TMG7-5b_MA50]|uniref:hypothetical protein n=1 Tax=Croceibacterium sp. TMG7-5b_MA50 TaxID=3121290 RepID=UPI003221B668
MRIYPRSCLYCLLSVSAGLLFAGAASAQTSIDRLPQAGRIVDGGTLEPGSGSLEHTLRLEAGKAVEITVLASGGFDPLLTVTAADGTQMAQDDDGAGNLNPMAVLFSETAQTVTLSISHSGGEGQAGGPVRILLMPTDYRPNTPRAITSGAEQKGLVSSNNPQVFTLAGEAGQEWEMLLAADASGLDAYLEVFGPDGESLAEDDDSGGSLNSRLVVTLPATGEYEVHASGLGAQNAAYQFVARDMAAVEPAAAQVLTFGERAAGKLGPLAPVQTWRLSPDSLPGMAAEGALLVRVTAVGWTPMVEAGFDTPFGYAMALASGESLDGSSADLMLPLSDVQAAGPWLERLVVQVSAAGGSTPGEYVVELVPATAEPVATPLPPPTAG